MKATLPNGILKELNDCYILCEDLGFQIFMKILPDISDGKGATYADETAIGRSFPIKNYSYSDNRTISWTMHLMVCEEKDIKENMETLRKITACVYPTQDETPYAPPPIYKLRCGDLLKLEDELCCVLRSYSVKYPTDVVWDENTYIPYKFDIELSFEVVYNSSELPYADDIVDSGG